MTFVKYIIIILKPTRTWYRTWRDSISRAQYCSQKYLRSLN